MVADAQNSSIVITIAAMISTKVFARVIVFNGEWFQLPVPSQIWQILENVILFACFLNENQHRKCLNKLVLENQHRPCLNKLVLETAPHQNIPQNGPRWIPRTKGQWRGALMFSLICVWINSWVNNREAGDLRCHMMHIYLSGIYASNATHVAIWCVPFSETGTKPFLSRYRF